MGHLLGVVGAGNMGIAILRGAVERGVLEAEQILVAEVDEARRRKAEALGCRGSADARDVAGSEQIMLAVKPQSFPEVAAAVGKLPRRTVVISIMAGLSSAAIRRGLGEEAAIVRVMPNTPCQIGLGISAVAVGEGGRSGDEELARRLFGSIGAVVPVEESDLYAVTAVSGSGPAYVFRLAEAMEQAAAEVGLSPEVARRLVAHTVRGAGALLVDDDASPAALREAVTSPGGTTAAALEVMERQDLAGIVVEAIAAARDRGVELDR